MTLQVVKRLIYIPTLWVFVFAIFSTQAQVTYTWTGTNNSDWADAGNWSPGGIPGAGDEVIINIATPSVELDGARSIAILRMSAANVLHLKSFSLDIDSIIDITAGVIDNGTYAAGTVTGTGLSSVNIRNITADAGFNLSGAVWEIRDNILNGELRIDHTGATNQNLYGGNTFNQDVYFAVSGTGRLQPAQSAQDVFNGNIMVSANGAEIRFGQGAGGSVILSDGYSINVGPGGFSSGNLRLRSFTQQGNTAQSLTFTGDAGIYIEAGCTWNGNVSFTAPRINTRESVYNGTAYLEKTGAGDDDSYGGNTFNGTTTVVQNGSARIYFAATAPDTFNGDVVFTNTGTSFMSMARNAAGNVFNGNIELNSSSGTGIYFGSGGGTSTQASGKTITIGAMGFSADNLGLRGITKLGADVVTLSASVGTLLAVENSHWNGNVSFTSGGVTTGTSTYEGTAHLEKTAGGNSDSPGGNTFNGAVTVINSGTARMWWAQSNPDIFNANVIFTNTGTSSLSVARTAAGNQFNGNIELNATATAAGIWFGANGGTSTQATATTLVIGGVGFDAGELAFNNFTKLGAGVVSLTAGTGTLTSIRDCVWNGNVSFTSGNFTTRSTTYEGTAYLEKTAGGNGDSYGNNTFNGLLTVVNSGSARIYFAVTAPDTFNDDVVFTNTGTSFMSMARNAAGNVFNGNIELNSSSGTGIYFGSGGGTSTQASGKTITIGAMGFSADNLGLRGITKLGADVVTLSASAGTLLAVENSHWNGNVSFTSGGVTTGTST